MHFDRAAVELVEEKQGRSAAGPSRGGAVLDADAEAARPWLVTRFIAGPAAALVAVRDAGLVHRVSSRPTCCSPSTASA
ncbi:hypothetical protein ACFZBU_35825 [Embleya sp. NPDC008237]|uniref:hypothetical protein n=1 Tax=Embleya sp. NPDC008237 TaxID=3363978 RepID=UPI0036EE6BF7